MYTEDYILRIAYVINKKTILKQISNVFVL